VQRSAQQQPPPTLPLLPPAAPPPQPPARLPEPHCEPLRPPGCARRGTPPEAMRQPTSQPARTRRLGGPCGGARKEMAPLGDTDGVGDRGRWYKRGGRLGPAPTDDEQVLNHSTRLRHVGMRWHAGAVGQAAHPLPPVLCPPQAPSPPHIEHRAPAPTAGSPTPPAPAPPCSNGRT